MTEGLECVVIHALVGKDKAAAKALSDFFVSWDPAPLEKDIAEADFMSSGEFFEGLAHAKMKAYLASSFDPEGACDEGTMALFLRPTQESRRRTDPWPDIALARWPAIRRR